MNKIYGKNTVHTFLETRGQAQHLYLQKGGEFGSLIALAQRENVPFSFKSKSFFDQEVKGNHQGVLLETIPFQYTDLKTILTNRKHDLILMADQIEDPHNLGAMIRTADAVGVDAVIIPKRRSVGVTDTVAKVSTGAIYTVPIHQAINLVDTIHVLKEHGYWVIGAENGVDAVNYTDFPVDMPIVLVMGSEGKGISRLVKENCDILTTIPMHGFVSSLNVSVATAILLYQINQKREK